MPYTPNSCFEAFNKNVINLNPDECSAARSSRDYLMRCITNLSQEEMIPIIYSEKNIFFGSFSRKTKVNPLDDIDIMITYSGQGGTYNIEKENERYTINIPSGINILSDLCDDGELNSRKVVNNLRDSLSDRSIYSKAEIHRNQEAVTLQLVSRPWNFDLVPSFFTTAGFYLIPDGKGKWKPANPSIDQTNVTLTNQAYNGQLLQLIRTMKYWKRKKADSCMSSYVFELLLIKFASQSIFRSYSESVCDALNYIRSNVYTLVLPDPKGFDDNLNTCWLTEQGQRLSEKAQNDAVLATYAINAERRGFYKEAIDYWRQIFGDAFPLYGV